MRFNSVGTLRARSSESSTLRKNVVQYRIQIWGELCLYVHLDQEHYFQSEFDPKKKPLDGLSPDDYKGMRFRLICGNSSET